METLIFYGLFALVGLAALRALLPARPAPPPIVSVVVSSPAEGGAGCLAPLILGGALIMALLLAGAT